jgi:hypothetical protein
MKVSKSQMLAVGIVVVSVTMDTAAAILTYQTTGQIDLSRFQMTVLLVVTAFCRSLKSDLSGLEKQPPNPTPPDNAAG